MGVILTVGGAGGGDSSDDLTGYAKHARKGFTFITHDSDDEPIEGQIPLKTSDDLIVDGPTVKTPYGYYDKEESATVASGTVNKPTVSKVIGKNPDGSLTHSASFTPSVSYTEGYISADSQDGDAATISASELVSGTMTKDVPGTYDVTDYASFTINLSYYDGSIS